MATIPSNTFKIWRDGDVVTASEYMQELEILRTAINANGLDISTLKNATLGVLKGVLNGTSFPPNPNPGDVFLRTDEDMYYFLSSAGTWFPLALNADLLAHAESTENPHKVSAAQIGTYTKTELDAKLLQKAIGAFRFEPCTGLFFTNGGSSSANANVTFTTPFTTTPVVYAGNTSTNVPYADTLSHPYIYNVTKTGFSCTIKAAGPLGTVGSPANLVMNFLAVGN